MFFIALFCCFVLTVCSVFIVFMNCNVKVEKVKEDRPNGLDFKADDMIEDLNDIDSDDEMGTPQSVIAHLHQSLNGSKPRPRILFDKFD